MGIDAGRKWMEWRGERVGERGRGRGMEEMEGGRRGREDRERERGVREREGGEGGGREYKQNDFPFCYVF